MIESYLALRLVEQCAEIARLDRHNRLTARFFLDDVQERNRCFRQGDIALVAILGPRQMRVALLEKDVGPAERQDFATPHRGLKRKIEGERHPLLRRLRLDRKRTRLNSSH